MEGRYITSVDLGSSKIALTVARVEGENLQILYYSESPSEGIHYSYVYNPKKASEVLKKAILEAEQALNIKITQAVVGLPRYYVKQETTEGHIDRSDIKSCISQEEIDALKDIALKEYPIDDESKEVIYEAIAQSFTIDDFHQAVEGDIVGMVSSYIKGNFKAYVGSKKAVSNIEMVLNNCDIADAGMIFTPTAVAKAILTKDERESGVALIEMGAGATSLTIYHNDILRYYASIPFGGKSITNDIKRECGISTTLAENLKMGYGACMPDRLASLSEKILRISYPDNGLEKQLRVQYLSEIITARSKEIIDAMLYMIQDSGFADDLGCGIVLTGGCANMANIANYIKELSGYNVKTGFPQKFFSIDDCVGIMETSAVSSVGMILLAKEKHNLNCSTNIEEEIIEENIKNEEDGTLLHFESIESTEEAKPKKTAKKTKTAKPNKPNPIWRKINNVVDNITGAVGSLYDEMDNE